MENAMAEERKARAVGLNHVALEVGDIEEALVFYRQLFDFKLRGKTGTSAFIDLGDQFLALQKGRAQPADEGRHFGLVVDDKDAVRKALADAGIKPLPGPFLDFLDPSRILVVGIGHVRIRDQEGNGDGEGPSAGVSLPGAFAIWMQVCCLLHKRL
jgi:lactoylglutathione lyase